MDFAWLVALGSLTVQGLMMIFALVVLRLPLSVRFARRVHRKRVLVLVLGLLAAPVPLFYFSQHISPGAGLYYAKYLIASVAAAVIQVILYGLEDKRQIPREAHTQLKM